MRSGVMAISVFLGMACLAASGHAQESPFFPLAEGYQWEFVESGGDRAHVWVGGTQVVQGEETTVLHWQFSGQNHDYLEQYCTVSADGEVLFHGFDNATAGFTLSYTPPFVYLASSLELGAEWCTTTQAYSDLEGTVPFGDPMEICLKVFSVGGLVVPAGSYVAHGVGWFLPGSRMPGVDMFGRRTVAGGRDATDWFAAGVGEIAFQLNHYFQLSSWSGPSTPVLLGSWGGLKSSFLPNNGLQAAGASPSR